MNYCNSSHILSKADNCLYVTLDDDLNIEGFNNKFKEFFYQKSTEDTKTFLDLFAPEDQNKLNIVFNRILNNKENAENLSAPIKTEQGHFNIDWTIGALINNGSVKGFEILGTAFQNSLNKEGAVSENKTTTGGQSRIKSVFSKLKKILDSSLDMICSIDENGRFTRVSAASKTILGYTPGELLCKNFSDLIFEEDLEATIAAIGKIKNGFSTETFENRYYKKDGSLVSLTWSSRWEEADKRFYCIARDVTEKKMDEAAIKISEEKYKMIFNNHPLPMFIYNIETLRFLEVNEATVIQYGFSREELLNMKVPDVLADKEVDRFMNFYVQKKLVSPYKGLWKHQKKNKEFFNADVTSDFIEFEGVEAKLVSLKDCTKQIIAEQEIVKSNERYMFLSKAFDAIWDWDLKTNEIQWNDEVKKMFEIANVSTVEKIEWRYNNMHPEDRERVAIKLKDHIDHRLPKWQEEYRFRTGDNKYKHICERGYTIYDENNKPVRMIGTIEDLTERKAHEDMLHQLNGSLEKRARELAASNAELERFAYVASHDLQEPLRMVSSFLQLLEKRYKDKLDQKAHEYIAYAVDGADRMKRLILDLLEYSRVNSSIIEKEDVDVNEVIDDLRLTYQNVLKETNGTITNQQLPLVKGNRLQILQLFQNLIGNAFKYRSDKPPAIDVTYKEENNAYTFAVTDNGLGIDPKFFEKIFIIFQRLHNREQYSGTGIGLAICKKIIDKHGGKIWVTSTPGEGSTFYFTLPKYKYEQIL